MSPNRPVTGGVSSRCAARWLCVTPRGISQPGTVTQESKSMFHPTSLLMAEEPRQGPQEKGSVPDPFPCLRPPPSPKFSPRLLVQWHHQPYGPLLGWLHHTNYSSNFSAEHLCAAGCLTPTSQAQWNSVSHLRVQTGPGTGRLCIFPLHNYFGRNGSEHSADGKCRAGVGHVGCSPSGKENSA